MRRAALALVLACACAPATPPKKSIDDFLPKNPLTQLANPMVGTGADGDAVPGATMPHGLVKLSPDTENSSGSVRAYAYGATKIVGFSHTHLEGPGGSGYGYGELSVMPLRGEVVTDESSYASTFSHENEVALPGYYAVDLGDARARAELTASSRCGFHRYTFTGDGAAHLLFDLAHSRGSFVSGSVNVVGDHTLEGTATYQVDPALSLLISAFERDGTTGLRTLYFHAETSRPFDSFGTWTSAGTAPAGRSASAQQGKLGAFVTFADASKAPVEVRLCLSAIDETQARKTFQEQAAGVSFDAARAKADGAWNELLNRVQVEGGSDELRRTFYTALYHAFMQPADATEDGRFWSGEDDVGKVESANGWRYYVDDWCLWDTFRTLHPLQNLLEPEIADDIVRSLVHGSEAGGWISKCTWQATGYSRIMISNPFVPVIADAYVKGLAHFDASRAYSAARHSEMEDEPESLADGVCGYFNQGTPPEYLQNGYVSDECDPGQSASMTLEYAFDDWAMARFAEKLGRSADEKLFDGRALNYRRLYNPAHGFMQARRRDGSWVEPFDPTSSREFTEASSWIYSWFAPHDVAGLIALMGGRDAFVAKLDQYFDGGHHDVSNEPGFSTPYLYDYAGAPAKTAERVRAIMSASFSNRPDGLPGNDDAGAMSAWFVFGAIGLYPISPGDSTLLIGSPQFEKATLYLEPNAYPGRTFVVSAPGATSGKLYVQSAKLDGKPLTHPWISHDDVVRGGALQLVMGEAPSDWGTAAGDAPPSLSTR